MEARPKIVPEGGGAPNRVRRLGGVRTGLAVASPLFPVGPPARVAAVPRHPQTRIRIQAGFGLLVIHFRLPWRFR